MVSKLLPDAQRVPVSGGHNLFRILVLLFGFLWSGFGVGFPQGVPQEKSVLFIVPMTALYCPLCDQMLGEFNRGIRSASLEAQTIAIFVPNCDHAVSEESLEASLIRKQIRGYAKSRDLNLPIIIDFRGEFAGMCSGDIVVLVFDWPNQRLLRYILPLTSEQWLELLANIPRE